MKVLHVTHQFPPETWGGLEVSVRDLALRQQAAGHEVSILSGSLVPGTGSEASTEFGLPVTRVRRDDTFFDWWDKGHCPRMGQVFSRHLDQVGPDVVHVHHWIRLTSNLVELAQARGIPTVVTLHDFAPSCPRAFRMRADDAACIRPLSVESCLDCVPRWPWQIDRDDDVAREIDIFRRNSRAELSRAGAILCATEWMRDLMAGALGLESSWFDVVPLAYEPRFTSRPASVESGPFRFGFWGAITHRKGVHVLVEAFRSLVEHRPPASRPVTLEVFGGFDTAERESQLRTSAEGLPIRFHGRYEYAELERAGLHAAVFPSLCFETYGLVLDEAFELGLPVVVPDLGALPERAGVAGLSFEVGDAGDLARKLGAVADDHSIRARLAAAVPTSSPDTARHAARIVDIYARVRRAGPDQRRFLPAVSPEERAENAFRREDALLQALLRRPPSS